MVNREPNLKILAKDIMNGLTQAEMFDKYGIFENKSELKLSKLELKRKIERLFKISILLQDYYNIYGAEPHGKLTIAGYIENKSQLSRSYISVSVNALKLAGLRPGKTVSNRTS